LELILEIVQRHCQGIEFREWNAGEKIDAHMKDVGFNVKIHCDIDKTGFCFGGNKDNCGTWMDKMGSSTITGNKGVPATPRDGAPIELVAMQYSIVSWLASLHSAGKISQNGVQIERNGSQRIVEFSDWATRMKNSFERCFWVPSDKADDQDHDIITKTVHRRGIYKDVYGSTTPGADYQLRPNICIAMSYAPQLFNPAHAKTCLDNVAHILMEEGCMGIKTLDPKDRQYNGDYINSDNTHGWNYHQGPEWVWPVGFFLKAQLLFCDFESKAEAKHATMKWLLPHKEHIRKDRW
jgi:glycogen debranching enzyme